MSIALQVQVDGLDRLQALLERLASIDLGDLLTQVGGVIESQTRMRISTEKRAPDGSAWLRLSDERYAAIKALHSSGGLLVYGGDLRDSIMFEVEGDTLNVGSNMVYAAAHQLGHEDLPARPYLGLSKDNEDEIESVVGGYLRDLMGLLT